MAEGAVDLRKLHEILRQEKKRKLLVPLYSDFYSSCQDYVASLSSEIKRREKKGEPSPQDALLREEYARAKNVIENIFAMRQRKILLMAYSLTVGEEVNRAALAIEERHFLDDVLALLRENREDVMGEKTTGKKKLKELFKRQKKTATPSEQEDIRSEEEVPGVSKYGDTDGISEPPKHFPIASDSPDILQPPVSSEESSEKADAKEGGKADEGWQETRTVVVLEDIPPLMGPDSVYELSKEDVASLPAAMARVLEEKGKVRSIDK